MSNKKPKSKYIKSDESLDESGETVSTPVSKSNGVSVIATLEQYLCRSGLPVATKELLIAEAKDGGNAKEILNKAVKMSGRKHMAKVPPTVTGK